MTANKLPSIHLHPVLIIFIMIAFLTGTFMELTIILTIVFIHELGHFSVARYFNWRIKTIMLWVFGGIMETDEHGTQSMTEEFFVIIAGPLQHLIIYLILYVVSIANLLPVSVLEVAYYYNTAILLFNLLPIWPLDGGKLLFIILSALFAYRKAQTMIISISIVMCLLLLMIQIMFFPFTLSAFMIMLFLLMENRTEWKQRYYVFIRFLLKRYEGFERVRGIQAISVTSEKKVMDVFSQFKREIKHPIYVDKPNDNRLQIDENDCLHSYFYEDGFRKTIGEIIGEERL